MASRFQSRLVGTIILVALGVIILPDVLDGRKSHYKEDIASIPLKPEVDDASEQYEILSPKEDSLTLPAAPVEAAVEKKVSSSGKASTSASETVEMKARDVSEKGSAQNSAGANDYQDSGWIIQLMALKNSDNAKKLVADLRKRGYQAHAKLENGYTRVIIGPDVSREKLEQQVAELQKITGSKGQLIKFRPLNP